jgi:hypothetical protein
MIAQELELTLQKAFIDASNARHEFVTTEQFTAGFNGQCFSSPYIACVCNEFKRVTPCTDSFY